MNTYHYKIKGMDCAEEIAMIKRVLLPTLNNEEERLRFDLLQGKLSVEAEDLGLSYEEVAAKIRTSGLETAPWREEGATHADTPPSGLAGKLGPREIFCLISGLGLLLGYAYHAWQYGFLAALVSEAETEGHALPFLSMLLYVVSMVTGARFFAPKGWFALRNLRPDINLLVTVAIIGAVGLGEWFEAAMVSFLFSVALLLESWSVGRARHAIRALMELSPQVARRLETDEDGKQREVEHPVGDIVPGDYVVVRPGERIPLDGAVLTGTTSVNQAPITGESMPVTKVAGDPVYAGAINNEGSIEVEVERSAQDSSLSRIIRMVEEAQSRRAPAEQWVEKFARYYTPTMMGLALLIAVFPPLALGMAWSEAIYLSLVMLLIACPCALVISTPVSIVAALSTAARSGILIKGGAYLEAPAHLQAIAFDKTGTLTLGKPQVQAVTPLNNHEESTLLRLAATLEARSQHPLAQAIVEHAETRGIAYDASAGHQSVDGKGATAEIEGKTYWIGNARFAAEQCDGDGADPQTTQTLENALAHAASIEDAGHSVVILGCEAEPMGLISIADTARPGAAETLQALKDLGIQHCIMLTGDNEGTARSLAEELHLDAYYAGLLPEDKVARMHALREKHGNVAMVGDGVNDAPAMAASGLAISMGAVGSDAAIETSDIALMSDDITRLPWLLRHSRRTLAIIKQNIVIALALKVVVLVLAFFGIAALWLAIVSDMGASLLVISNALRLLRDKSAI